MDNSLIGIAALVVIVIASMYLPNIDREIVIPAVTAIAGVITGRASK